MSEMCFLKGKSKVSPLDCRSPPLSPASRVIKKLSFAPPPPRHKIGSRKRDRVRRERSGLLIRARHTEKEALTESGTSEALLSASPERSFFDIFLS